MVRTLYLLRHARTEEGGYGKKDFDRGLSAEGLRQASKLGLHFKAHQVQPDFVLLSPSVRTRQTFERINEQMAVNEEDVATDEDIYEASVRTLLKSVCSLDVEVKTALVVGHNPSVSYLSEYLTGEAIGNVSPASYVQIEFNCSSWEMVSEKSGVFVRKYEIEEF